MDLKIIWHKPIPLTDCGERASRIYDVDLKRIPRGPGVYIFMRKHGRNRNALYIGQAQNLRARIKGQLNALHLMKGILNASTGLRVLMIGEFIPKKAQRTSRCLGLIEMALIRHFLSKGHELLNKSGTRLAKHSLTSELVTGYFIPHKILFE